MKLKRGAALPGAIILCLMMVLVSLAISTLFLNMTATNVLNRTNDEKSLKYVESFNQFKQDWSKPEDSGNVTWKVLEKDANVKALVAYEGSSIAFYAIYDNNEHKVLAYQASNIYIVDNKLGGIVPLEE